MQPAIFLDRDGTVIYDRVYLNDPNLVEFIPGAIDALKLFKQLGYKLIIITNQSGVARGLVQLDKLEAIHKRMQKDIAAKGLSFDGFYYSPHSVESDHFQRKPNPGMIEDAIRDHNVDRNGSWMIGDKMSDVEAGHRARVRSIFIIGTEDPTKGRSFSPPHYTAKDLLDAANYLQRVKDR